MYNVVITQGTLSAGSNLFNQQGEDASWARCQAFAYHVPPKGQLGIRVYACDGSRAPVAVECSDLLMHSIPSGFAPSAAPTSLSTTTRTDTGEEKGDTQGEENVNPLNSSGSGSGNGGGTGGGSGSGYGVPTGHKLVGGDYPGWNSEMSSCLSLRGVEGVFEREWRNSGALRAVLRGYEPLRAVSWNGKAVVRV